MDFKWSGFCLCAKVHTLTQLSVFLCTFSNSCNSVVSSTSLSRIAWATLHLLRLMMRSAAAPPRPVAPAVTSSAVPAMNNGVVAPTKKVGQFSRIKQFVKYSSKLVV